MKCHYTYDPESGEKVFIPMCYGTIYTLDKEDCHCADPLQNWNQFEKERFNKILEQKNESIKSMQSEIIHLRKVIEKLKSKVEI